MTYTNHPSRGSRKPKLLDQVRQAIRTRHDSIRTEEAYAQWMHELDMQEGFGSAYVPYALERKYPHANRQ